VSVGNGFQDGKARSVDLDLSSPEGRSAYERFIGAGRLPASGAPGSSDPTTSQSATSTHTDQITVKVGPLGGTAGGTTDQGQVVETVHADGTKVTTSFSRRGATVLALDQILAAQRGRDGTPFEDGGTRDQLRAYLAEHPDGQGLAPYGGVKDQIILTDMAPPRIPSACSLHSRTAAWAMRPRSPSSS
jgi:hypothetical protein